MSKSPPEFYKDLKDITVPEGECTVLECRLKAVPSAQVTWLREGHPIEDSADFRILHNGDIASLVIGTAYSEDSGVFECVATNSEGTARSSCNVMVTGGGYYSVSTKEPTAAKIVTVTRPSPASRPPTQDALIENHNKDKLSADDIRGVSYGEVREPRDYVYSPRPGLAEEPPQEFKVSSFEQRLINEIEYRLERTPPVNEDPNDIEFESVSANEQKPPFFKNIVGSYKVIIGSPMKFMCRVGGSPVPKIYWFKDGKQISIRSQHYLRSKEEGGIYSLSIPRTCAEDGGNYTVLAVNPKGRVSCTGKLAIVTNLSSGRNQPIPERSQVRMPEKGTLAEDEESPLEKCFKPVFVQKSGNIEVDAGKLARLDVKVTGLPAPDLDWFINGHPVRQDQHHRIIVRENNVHSLLIQPVDGMDEGQYSVVASNRAGKATVHMELRVRAQEETTVPIFVKRLTTQAAAEGGAVRLEACVIGKPQPKICWKKGSDEVINSPRTQILQDDSGNVCLLISEATRYDSDWYTCSATNKAGIASCNCKLDVYSPTMDAPHQRRRIRTPHRYANLAKTAGIDMRESITPDPSAYPAQLPESEDL